MVNYLPQIAIKGNANRKRAIESILSENGISYSIIGATTQNIVVSMNPSVEKRIVIGAHYDAFSEYIEAANDNAAACVILMNLILLLRNNTDRGYDFVFFDGEDSKPPIWNIYGREIKGFVGSMEYISAIGKKNIEAMINLDMCGMGNNIVLSYSQNSTLLTTSSPYKEIIGNCPNAVKMLPPGDSVSFERNGIPYIFIINSTNRDLDYFKDFARNMQTMPPQQLMALTEGTDFGKTMHKQTDTVDSFTNEGTEGMFEMLNIYL